MTAASNEAQFAKPQKAWKRPRAVTPGRWVAFLVVGRVFGDGAYADKAFTAEADSAQLDPRERSQAQYMAYGTVQQAKLVDHVIATVGKRPLRKIDGPVLQALRLGAFQLVCADGIAEHAAIDQTVEIVRATVGERAVAFTNAVMRRIQVDGQTIIDRLDVNDIADRATLLSVPEWLLVRLNAAYGERGVEAIVAQVETTSANSVTVVRCNTLRGSIGDCAAALQKSDSHTIAVPEPIGELLPELRAVTGSTAPLSRLFEDGMAIAQAASSALVTHVLDPQPGDSVLDMCAAPGGKTTHIAARLAGNGSILACELHDHRAQQLESLVLRMGANVVTTVQCCDSTALGDDVGMFDRILLDAPCSGMGVISERPDLRWKRTEESIEELVTLQRALLGAAAQRLKPDGVLVYSTCTLLPEENEQNIEWAHSELGLQSDPIPAELIGSLETILDGSAIHVWPQDTGSAGFFIARLRK